MKKKTIDDVDRTLLLFDKSLPCWDRDTMSLAGEDPDAIDILEEHEFIKKVSRAYVLTYDGITRRELIGGQMGVPTEPTGEIITDISIADERLEVNRAIQLLDHAFYTEWGLKENSICEDFPVMPNLIYNEYFELGHKCVKAIWTEHEYVQKFFKDFPHVGVEARKYPAPGLAAFNKWAYRNDLAFGKLNIDLVMRLHADFEHYRIYSDMDMPTDIFNFLNVDRLFVHYVRDYEKPVDLLPFIGKFHIFLTGQKRIFLPGWFDIDQDENEDWTMLLFITEYEDDIQFLTKFFREECGHDLIDPVNPLFLLGTSMERLRNQKEQKSTVYDWFQEEATRIMRPDAPDGE